MSAAVGTLIALALIGITLQGLIAILVAHRYARSVSQDDGPRGRW